ncbi:MAG: alpha-crystallin/Hsp20 family ATP-independent chaperone [uncultured bacterium]|uniref:ATP-independent chaperone, alpha-crystallin/Hsp20 family n=1 Tax=Citrifermentans bemidjiense (strain ATCC BAA-1014 / DSM 16622 / JCM 12645 / Bem) TaxID=404380 RepID=B5EDN0_CITBB|nr:Hsp20/alpha crystallin family protein [Citrifermentans bemidjiense]ACH40658.1 ATP-independent chaperone, alpha-crystallin/Hsp20 family [Citrifermentans bemidjiense Bem]EKD34707.1 MAG: alpha-crystallin/Hsp20 family ATP-independent chaperone [uncultured bacterium]
MAPNSLTERNDERNVQTREETRSNERYIRPAVNIVETEEGLFLTADLPGVAKGDIDVNVEKGILTITAPAKSTLMGTPVYSEFQLGNYYRQFTIPESLDHEKAKADFVNGILTLRIPKAEIAKPRRIEVQIG